MRLGESNTSVMIEIWIGLSGVFFLEVPTYSAETSFLGLCWKQPKYLGCIRSNVQSCGPGYVGLSKIVRHSAEHTKI